MKGSTSSSHPGSYGYCERDSRNVAIMIPEGAVIVILAGPFNGTRLMDVMYDGETIMMFTDDMKTHTELVTGEASGS